MKRRSLPFVNAFMAAIAAASIGCAPWCGNMRQCGALLDTCPLKVVVNALSDCPACTSPGSCQPSLGCADGECDPSISSESAFTEEAMEPAIGASNHCPVELAAIGACEAGIPSTGCPSVEVCPVLTCPTPGPPPERYRPPMPPTFLPVPTRPVVAASSADAPRHEVGDVEIDYGPRLSFPGRQ